MKILSSLSNFIWLFIVIGVVLIKVVIFPSESTPPEPFSFGRITYAVGEFVISFALSIVFFYLLIRFLVWREDKKRARQSK